MLIVECVASPCSNRDWTTVDGKLGRRKERPLDLFSGQARLKEIYVGQWRYGCVSVYWYQDVGAETVLCLCIYDVCVSHSVRPPVARWLVTTGECFVPWFLVSGV